MRWRWPWVSRSLYDQSFEYWERTAKQAYGQYLDSRTAYGQLLDRYHALKLHGASIPTVPTPLKARTVDPVVAQILAESGRDQTLRGAMLREAQRLRDANFSDQQIIERIQEGTQSLEGLPA